MKSVYPLILATLVACSAVPSEPISSSGPTDQLTFDNYVSELRHDLEYLSLHTIMFHNYTTAPHLCHLDNPRSSPDELRIAVTAALVHTDIAVGYDNFDQRWLNTMFNLELRLEGTFRPSYEPCE
jgi:hypothetical protein|tara:strand:- start:538 stop:912 length:375 start_codon:yes stop_codon:yes gene_type:complete